MEEENEEAREESSSSEVQSATNGESVDLDALEENLSDPIRPDELHALIKLEPIDYDDELTGN